MTLGAHALAHFLPLGGGHKAVPIRIEPLETPERPAAELRQGDHAVLPEAALRTTLAALRLTLTALGAALGTLGAGLGALFLGKLAVTIGVEALEAHRRPLGTALGPLGLTLGAARFALLGASGVAALAGFLDRQLTVAIGVEARKALLGASDCLLTGDFRRAGVALARLRRGDPGAGKQGTGEQAEFDGFHEMLVLS